MAFVPPARHLLRAKDLADAWYFEPLGVDDLARTAGLSRAHFSREFRRTFGESPHAYLLTRRLERAAALLRTTDRSVADICVSVGLQLELERIDGGSVRGRFFVKQDHQGPPGYAHGGIVATALDEAMALLIHDEGTYALTTRLEIDLEAPAPVGEFLEVEARLVEHDGRRLTLSAEARADDKVVGRATGVFVEVAGNA